MAAPWVATSRWRNLTTIVGVGLLPLALLSASDGPGFVAVAPQAVAPLPVVELPPNERWTPSRGTPWQWQLQGEIDTGLDVPIYDLDGFTTSRETVAELHAQGRRTICYLNVGAWESWRPDADRFPGRVLGEGNGWPGERWLDVRRLDLLSPVLRQRITTCRAKGFDAVEPDNVDGYANDSGFPLTGEDQLRFNRWVAEEVHRQGMSVALKNDLEQVEELVDDFDFAINEQCFEYDECELLLPFLHAGQAVLHVEYDLPVEEFCGAVPRGFSSMRKRPDLDAWREPCPGADHSWER